ncbi:nicotinate-nucleotide--dimethylbenzimidazole phosphoribosyltransferase [Agarivorans gilvus]|uniref:Nicotinate-nucleotide--dimethylbenzimidazole phosphoribosyltransferase n=1 Tax=Agarivorans gilvus TaxID=680279 RepID=A0ABQ1I2F3_9ALTE|nr:nicotinate-nucleotide--dimethylbenzimidazole phosphoribosyltransferase [Agarivorans gilvus]GGB09752.1 nicotinate-nucleotide--dimethylbenzimidazole phosphoribosyltransferase [Agarivorans gilvus]
MHNKFIIEALDEGLAEALMEKINLKTKPPGSLGVLEALACQLGQIQQTLSPQICQPKMIVFASDHGIALEGVSAFPQEVTAQMVQNYLAGGAAVNVFCRQHAIALEIVDLGVKNLPAAEGLVSRKVAESTQSFLQADAMTPAQCQQAISVGAERVSLAAKQGSNVVAFGEMGIANTASAAAVMAGCLNIDVAECVGRGTGLDDKGLQHKTAVLQQAMAYHQGEHTPEQWLAKVGGFELAAMVGAMLQAAQLRMTIMVDGFICSAAALVASQIAPLVTQYMVFCHQSAEQAHQRLLDVLGANPLLGLALRLGEGSGAALAFPLVQSACLFLNEMASFASAGVSREHD